MPLLMGNDRYAAHELLARPARSRPELWRLFVGLGLVFAIVFSLSMFVRAAVGAIAPEAVASPEGALGNTPASLLVLLYSFGLVIVATFIAARSVQNRAPLGLIGPIGLALAQFWKVFRLLFVLGIALVLLPPYDMGEALVRNLELGLWLKLLPLSLGAILVQTSSEEILFRGYVQQTLAARFSSPLIWMVLPAVLFGMGHFVPDNAGGNAWLVAVWAALFGLLMADLTARAGTLGPAIAVHTINNISAILIVSVPDTLSGLSLATTPYPLSNVEQMRGWLMFDLAFMIVSWLAARLAIRR